jgi:CheY-like chemotaxis protein
MRRAHAEPKSGIQRSPRSDLPRVLVAEGTTTASPSVAQALRAMGYVVSTTQAGTEALRDLRRQDAIELLVVDASGEPQSVGMFIEAVRSDHWALPILLIAGADRELRAEAERLGVEAVLEGPVTALDVGRAATKILPVPEVDLALAG